MSKVFFCSFTIDQCYIRKKSKKKKSIKSLRMKISKNKIIVLARLHTRLERPRRLTARLKMFSSEYSDNEYLTQPALRHRKTFIKAMCWPLPLVRIQNMYSSYSNMTVYSIGIHMSIIHLRRAITRFDSFRRAIDSSSVFSSLKALR